MSERTNGRGVERPLVVVAPLRPRLDSSGRVRLTQKFVDGMARYARSWRGPVIACCEPGTNPGNQLDYVTVDPTALPFGVRVASFDSPVVLDTLATAGVVLAALSYRQHHIAPLLRSRSVPCAYVVEYTLATRLRQVRASTPNPARRWRRYVWEINQERKIRAAIRASTALQCNGVAAFETYARLQANRLLYLDSQASVDDLVSEDSLLERTQHLLAGGPLRLAFWGRLIPIKGVEHLVPLARALQARHVPFEMAIAGDGSLRSRIAEQIERHRLGSTVRLLGTLPFRDELAPRMRRDADVFVCCHPQGDPSSSFVEALAFGLPLAGFGNAALAGLLRDADVGWAVPVGAIDALADQLATLHRRRELIVAASGRALALARQNNIDMTTARRLDHLRSIARTDA